MVKLSVGIPLSQFLCTSVWFAGNSVAPDLARTFNLGPYFVSQITSAVQFGFIAGAFLFAILAVADRFSPVRVFFTCSVLAAAANGALFLIGGHADLLLILRFITGFFLAGIYPVGMKIAADHAPDGLGKLLGLLVGALVLGTASPYLVRLVTIGLPWTSVIATTSVLSLLGGAVMILVIGDGRHRVALQRFSFNAVWSAFRVPEFRMAAAGYFGHMWELYAFWAFVPWMVGAFNTLSGSSLNVTLVSFFVVAIGGPGCFLSGFLSAKYGAKRLAAIALSASGLCCAFSWWFFSLGDRFVFTLFMLFWGTMVAADSPLFSTLAAGSVPPAFRGSALTIMNCIGFAITILSIQLMGWVWHSVEPNYVSLLLAPGPVLGLWGLHRRRG